MVILKLKKQTTRGFSLIEVVVSLVVLSVSILSIYQVIVSNTASIMYVEDRYLAKEVSNNRVAMINTLQKPRNAVRRNGIMKMGNKVWQWEEVIEKNSSNEFLEYEIIVRRKGANKAIYSTKGYLINE
ncbi:type II secretion system minor pseudopilin GspI [Gammaproteobacteria bacterium]|nr:type II secretion system minor pseudopilin GspI [Gammaproteobacteria bacterium]